MRRFALFLSLFCPTLLTLTVSSQVSWAQQQTNPSGSGLQTLAVGDLVGDFGARDRSTFPSQLTLREAEFGFFAPADYLFDAAAFFAAHNENGELVPEVHEVYLSSSKLVRNSRLKVGYYFLNFGRLNSFHRHDWLFTSAPLTHRKFFGEEAVADGGLEYSWLVPQVPFYLDLTFGVASGYQFGHEHGVRETPIVPTHYLRAVHYASVGESSGMQWGLNYVGRKTAEDGQMTLIGFDWVTKLRELSQTRWVFHLESWYRNLAESKEWGGYLYSQYGIPDSRVELGLRLDAHRLLDGSANAEFAVVPQVTFRPSEFTQLRASVETRFASSEGSTELSEHLLQLQTTFLLGAHPAHEF